MDSDGGSVLKCASKGGMDLVHVCARVDDTRVDLGERE